VTGATAREVVLRTPEGLRGLDPLDGRVSEPFLAVPPTDGPVLITSLRDGLLATTEEAAVAFVGAARERRWRYPRPPAADSTPSAFLLEGMPWLHWCEETRAGPETGLVALDERSGEPFSEHRVAGAFVSVRGAGDFAAGVLRAMTGPRAFAWSPAHGGIGGDRTAPDSAVRTAHGVAAVVGDHHHVARTVTGVRPPGRGRSCREIRARWPPRGDS
jgi:hypothetical protein